LLHRMYRTNTALPITHWDLSPAAVQWVHWSTSCPGVFYVVDSTPCVHLWNLLVTDKVRRGHFGCVRVCVCPL
jgi:hypothetical protein